MKIDLKEVVSSKAELMMRGEKVSKLKAPGKIKKRNQRHKSAGRVKECTDVAWTEL